MVHAVQRHAAFMQQVLAETPGEHTVANVLLAQLMGDDAWLALLSSEEPATLFLPYFAKVDLTMADAATRLGNGASFSGFYGAGDVALPPGARLLHETTYGAITVRWIDGALPWGAPKKPTPAPAVDVAAALEKNLAHLERGKPVRQPMDASKRPYARLLAASMGETKLDPAAITFETPSPDDVRACERAFLEAVAKDLRDGTSTVVRKERRHGFTQLFVDFPRYEAQIAGWRVGGSRYLFFKFRLPSKHLPPLTGEYFVRDGGAAYFEFQCALPGHAPFNVVVHGEA